MGTKKKTTAETCQKIEKMFSEIGQKSGNAIESIAKKLHPDALFTLPLYRGCLVVLKQEDWEIERGSCTIMLYHDPCWMGEELNEKTLPRYSEELRIFGQRSGHDLIKNGEELYSAGQLEMMKSLDRIMKEQNKKIKIIGGK